MFVLSVKRWAAVVIFLSVLAGGASASHFTLSPHSNKGTMTVFIDTVIHPLINGVLLGKGDEIAVFDTLDSCYGDVRWDSVSNQSISVWAIDPQSSPTKKNGMAEGERMRFKVWDSSASLLVPTVTVSFYPAGVPTPPPINTAPFTGSTYSMNGLSILSGFAAVSLPTAPVLALPTNGAGGQPVSLGLSWGTSALATSYEVQVSLSSAFNTTVLDQSGATLTSVTAGGLTNNMTYYWHVNALNASGTSWSGVWSFTTIVGAPAAPALASPTNGASGQMSSLSLTWGTVTGAISYTVLVSTVSSFATTVFAQSGATTTASVSNLSYPGIPYYWQVNVSNVGGNTWSGIWSFTTLAVPAAPAIVLPTNFTNNQQLVLSWSSVATATSYTIQVSTISTFTSTTFSQSGLTTGCSCMPTHGILNYCRINTTNVAGTGPWAVWTLIPNLGVTQAPLIESGGYEFSMKQSMIVYSLPKAGQVELSICDMLGRTAMAVNRMQDAGHYTIDLKSSPLASGRYTVRFKAGTLEKRAVLILTR